MENNEINKNLGYEKEASKPKRKQKRKKGKLRETIEMIISAILIALFIRVFIIEAYKIPTGSMYPTLQENDHLIVNKFSFGVRLPVLNLKLPSIFEPESGDIIVFQVPKYDSPGAIREFLNLINFGIFNLDNTEDNPKNYIKRAIGTPGDTIKFVREFGSNLDLQLHSRNGKKIEHKYIDKIKYPNDNRNVANRVYYLYDEVNGDKTYQIQRIHYTPYDDTNITKEDLAFLYIPNKGDKLKIKRKLLTKRVYPDIGFNEFDDVLNVTIEKIEDGKVVKTYELTQDIFEKFFLQKSEIYSNFGVNLPPKVHKDIQKLIETPEIESEKEMSYSFTFEENYYLMMGDNRDSSEDSRVWGLLRESYIIGSALLIYFPIQRTGSVSQRIELSDKGVVKY